MIEPFRHYHAPWSRWFKTFFLRGSYAWELQVGPIVLQLVYRNKPVRTRRWNLGRFNANLDPFWR